MHFFGGTPDDPILTATRFVRGSATGLGDVDARVKVNLRRAEPLAVGVLADVRFPTGSDHDLLGSGAFAARGLAILSAHFGDFSPHANVGYLYRGGEFETDAVLGTLGFDHLLAPWATLAVDLISQLQVGDSPLQVPGAGRDPVAVRPHHHAQRHPGPARRRGGRLARAQAHHHARVSPSWATANGRSIAAAFGRTSSGRFGLEYNF